MENAITESITQILQLSPVVAVLTVFNAIQGWVISALLRDAKNERTIYRATIQQNTDVIAHFTEVMRAFQR